MWIPDPLYQQILEVMPIPCVDVMIRSPSGQVLLIKRENEPAKGQWWFPGGRILHGETRVNTARRKLREECGIDADEFVEVGTFDLLLPLPGGRASHAVTTLYATRLESNRSPRLDKQSSTWQWKFPGDEFDIELHPFIQTCLAIRHDAAGN